jgi:hypothetical protein
MNLSGYTRARMQYLFVEVNIELFIASAGVDLFNNFLAG